MVDVENELCCSTTVDHRDKLAAWCLCDTLLQLLRLTFDLANEEYNKNSHLPRNSVHIIVLVPVQDAKYHFKCRCGLNICICGVCHCHNIRLKGGSHKHPTIPPPAPPPAHHNQHKPKNKRPETKDRKRMGGEGGGMLSSRNAISVYNKKGERESVRKCQGAPPLPPWWRVLSAPPPPGHTHIL